MTKRFVFVACALLSSVASGSLFPAAADEPIKIGIPIGLSGANSVVAPSVVQSAELAVQEINAAGGVLGRLNSKSRTTRAAPRAPRRRSTI